MAAARSLIGRSLAATWCMGLGLVIGGCKSAPVPTAFNLHEIGETTLPATTGRELLPTTETAEFVSWEPDSGERLRIVRSKAEEPREAWWQRRFRIVEGREIPIREQHIRMLGDGSIALAEELNHIEKVEVVFEPPLVVLPTTVKQGAVLESQGRMTVHPPGDRTRMRAKGTYRDSMTCEGPVIVRTPRGEERAWKFRSRFTAQLGPSRVVNETETWLVPGHGLIAERRGESTTALGIPVRSNAETWVIIDEPRR